MAPRPVNQATRGELASAISTGAVKLMREYTGRGPTKARTYVFGDYIAVVTEDNLTKGERSLVDDGRSDLVLSTRRAYQQAMRTALIELVSDLSGRPTIAFLSDNHLDPDIAVESFILEPPAVDAELLAIDLPEPAVSRDSERA